MLKYLLPWAVLAASSTAAMAECGNINDACQVDLTRIIDIATFSHRRSTRGGKNRPRQKILQHGCFPQFIATVGKPRLIQPAPAPDPSMPSGTSMMLVNPACCKRLVILRDRTPLAQINATGRV